MGRYSRRDKERAEGSILDSNCISKERKREAKQYKDLDTPFARNLDI